MIEFESMRRRFPFFFSEEVDIRAVIRETKLAFGAIMVITFVYLFAICMAIEPATTFSEKVGTVIIAVLAVLMAFCGYVSVVASDIFVSLYRRICKGLAGLEVGIYHDVDDLRFALDIPQDIAEDIIDGKYDYLLSDELVCEYIGRKEVHDVE